MERQTAPKGTYDLLPPEGDRLDALEAAFAALARRYGYRRVVIPMFEHTEVFLRVGESTDIVRKEMYTFLDKGDRSLTLRPEGTAGVVRAFVEHGIGRREALPWKVFYTGSGFRYEQPQKGRTREHEHYGVEAIGDAGPDIDVEVIDLAMAFLTDVGAGPLDLLVNSMGDPVCKPAFVAEFRRFLAGRAGDLCEECHERARLNPLRTLDCKKPPCRAVTAGAPRFVDHLCEPCRDHFAAVEEGVADVGWVARLEPRLVRGQDYYTRTTFEIQTTALDAAQNALGGGGRYDGLVVDLGGDPTPAIGFGLGAYPRVLAVSAVAAPAGVPAMVVDLTETGVSGRRLLVALRRGGVGADSAGRGRSMKAQMRTVERAGAAVAVIVGPDEEEQGSAKVKDLRSGEQTDVPFEKVPDEVRGML